MMEGWTSLGARVFSQGFHMCGLVSSEQRERLLMLQPLLLHGTLKLRDRRFLLSEAMLQLCDACGLRAHRHAASATDNSGG